MRKDIDMMLAMILPKPKKIFYWAINITLKVELFRLLNEQQINHAHPAVGIRIASSEIKHGVQS